MWDGGLRALRVLKYVVSNPKDEVTRLEYTTRKTAGRIPLSSTPMEVAILKYMFVLFWESTCLAWVDSGLQLLVLVSPFKIICLDTSENII